MKVLSLRPVQFLAFVVLTFALIAIGERADARPLKVRPDGNVRFTASMDGPTRISVVGERIAKLIQTDSQFEMKNDPDTGDIFLRFIGTDAVNEDGYIITESGHTISFTLTPRTGSGSQTVLVELVGLPASEEKAESGEDDDGFEVDTTGSGGGHANDLVAFTREAFNARIGLKSAGSIRSKGVFKTFSKGGLRASIRSVPAAQSLPSPQAFYNSRTQAVFIDDVTNAGRVWVIVVEGK